MKVLTVGTFDLLHSGHVTLFASCRTLAGPHGKVVVGVNSSEFVATFKRPPVHLLAERLVMVKACRDVDEVIVNHSSSLEDMLIAQRPEYLVIGSDWAPPKDYLAQIGTTTRWLETHGVTLIFLPRDPSAMSSTEVRNLVHQRDECT